MLKSLEFDGTPIDLRMGSSHVLILINFTFTEELES